MKKSIIFLLLLILGNASFAQSKNKSNRDKDINIAYEKLSEVKQSLTNQLEALTKKRDSLNAAIQKMGQDQRSRQTADENKIKACIDNIWSESNPEDQANRPLTIFARKYDELSSTLSPLADGEWKKGYELLLKMIRSLDKEFNPEENTDFKSKLENLPDVKLAGGTNLTEKVKYGIINFRNIKFEFERVKKLVDDAQDTNRLYEHLMEKNELTYVMMIPYYDREIRNHIQTKSNPRSYD